MTMTVPRANSRFSVENMEGALLLSAEELAGEAPEPVPLPLPLLFPLLVGPLALALATFRPVVEAELLAPEAEVPETEAEAEDKDEADNVRLKRIS
jgi:hypothetical protein